MGQHHVSYCEWFKQLIHYNVILIHYCIPYTCYYIVLCYDVFVVQTGGGWSVEDMISTNENRVSAAIHHPTCSTSPL